MLKNYHNNVVCHYSIEYLLFYICIFKMIAYHKGGDFMKHIKIAAGLAHVNYGNIAGLVKRNQRRQGSTISIPTLPICMIFRI